LLEGGGFDNVEQARICCDSDHNAFFVEQAPFFNVG
jgi:hypothetical protein